MKASPVIDRLLAKIERIPFSGCWIWMGTTAPGGYGLIGHGKTERGNARMVYTHRVSFEHFVGPILEGKEICHRCDVSSCCNPGHLFSGTHKENIQDMMSKQRGDAYRRGSSPNCPRGHALSGENLHIRPDGRRACRKCRNAASQRRRSSK